MSDSIFLKKEAAMRVTLYNHLLALFRDRPKVKDRRSFCAIIRQGGFKVVRPRDLKCCDVIIMETSLAPEDHVSEELVGQSLDRYIHWELKFY